MSDRVPACIAVYVLDRVPPRRIVEFRWSEETGVTWSVLDAESVGVVEEFTDGLRPTEDAAGPLRPLDGEDFMHALARQDVAGARLLVDESDEAGDWARTENPMGPATGTIAVHRPLGRW